MKSAVNEQWVEDNFSGCELGNSRRTERLQKVALNMVNAPDQSLPTQNGNWADTKAAYRLFQQKDVTFDAVSNEHWKRTRAAARRRCLLISDTTDIDHFSHRSTTGLGMLGKGEGRGVQLHSCIMYDTCEKQLLGSAGALVCLRKFSPPGETRMTRLARHRESERWGELVEAVGPAPEDSQWIHVFDRGGDCFEAICHIKQTDNDWVIRASKLQRNVVHKDKKAPLREVLEQASSLGSYELHLKARRGLQARVIETNVSTVSVTVPRPRHASPWVRECGISELQMNVVDVRQVNEEDGKKPLHWVLFTSLPVDSFDDAWQIIEDYENRWLIEEYHRVLKTGCRAERHALREIDRIAPLLALTAVTAIRLLQLKLIGREQKDAQAVTHVPATWLKALVVQQPKVVLKGLTVYHFMREVAKLGGFLARKSDGEPGWETTWRGHQKLQQTIDVMRKSKLI